MWKLYRQTYIWLVQIQTVMSNNAASINCYELLLSKRYNYYRPEGPESRLLFVTIHFKQQLISDKYIILLSLHQILSEFKYKSVPGIPHVFLGYLSSSHIYPKWFSSMHPALKFHLHVSLIYSFSNKSSKYFHWLLLAKNKKLLK